MPLPLWLNARKRMYDKRVHEVAKGTFSPLVFSTTGEMGTYVAAKIIMLLMSLIIICYYVACIVL